MRGYYLDRFDSAPGIQTLNGVDGDGADLREGLLGVLGKHGDEDVDDNLDFGFVGRCCFDKYVLCFGTYLRVVAVDDGR